MKISYHRWANTPSGNEKVWTAEVSKARLRLIKRMARRNQRFMGLPRPITLGLKTEISLTHFSYFIVDLREYDIFSLRSLSW